LIGRAATCSPIRLRKRGTLKEWTLSGSADALSSRRNPGNADGGQCPIGMRIEASPASAAMSMTSSS